VADVASDIDGIVEANGTWGRGHRVGGAEDEAADLDDLAALPDHGADGARGHVCSTTVSRLDSLEMMLKGGVKGSLQETRPGKKGLPARSA